MRNCLGNYRLRSDTGEILTNEAYKWNPTNDIFDFTGRSYITEKIAEKKGISIEEAMLKSNVESIL